MAWEHGSELVLPLSLAGGQSPTPWGAAGNYYGSGRDALRDLLRHGATVHGWKRLRVPFYFCQHVAQSAALELPVVGYTDTPELKEPDERELDVARGDVVLVPNYFGQRTSRWRLRGLQAHVIEDHTHDPWSEWAVDSTADFAIASLRKTLPLPAGGVLWSPSGRALPRQPSVTEERELASLRKFQAQSLKALYLRGASVPKQTFRELAVDAEAHIASGAISGMPAGTRSLLDALPTESWRRTRERNHAFLLERLSTLGWSVLPGEAGSVPLSAVVVFPSPVQQSALRAQLVARNIYPAVLWPLEHSVIPDIPYSARSFASRMLSLACDARYREEDLQRLVKELAAAANALS